MKQAHKKQILISIFIAISTILMAQQNFDELSKKGQQAISEQNYEKALEYFTVALQNENITQENKAWTAGIAAICAQQLNDDAKTTEFCKQAIKNHTLDYSIYDMLLELSKKTNDIKTQEEVLEAGRKKLEKLYQRYTTELLYLHFNQKNYVKIPQIADEVLTYKPQNIRTHYFKGVAYLNLKKEKEAIETFDYILAKDSLHLNVHKQLGFLYFQKGSTIYERAKKKYNALKKPTRQDYTNYRNLLKTSYEPYNKASLYLERAYQIKPDNNTKKMLISIYTRLEQKEKVEKLQ